MRKCDDGRRSVSALLLVLALALNGAPLPACERPHARRSHSRNLLPRLDLLIEIIILQQEEEGG
jgi:hypothetical protein